MEEVKTEKVDIWKKIKTALTSKDKLVILSKFDQVEMNLFTKALKTYENYNETTLTLNSTIQNLLENEYFKEPITINIIKRKMTGKEAKYLAGEIIDNTGNLNLWPSEEILTVFILLNKQLFENKKILELGAGFSGLSGLVLSKYITTKHLLLTDGNTRCVQSLLENIKHNKLNEDAISARFLLWNRFNPYEDVVDNEDNQYDIILLSDCLFFKNYHDDLIHTIKSFLRRTSGVCIIVTPSRGKSMDVFLEKAKVVFNVYIGTNELKFIELTKTENYEPYYIELRKNN
jgi:predicted nicotinamide N-methyase